jgi:integrase
MNHEAREIIETDFDRIKRELNREAKLSWREKRFRVAVLLSATSGIRLSELLRLTLADTLDRVEQGWRVREIIFLTKDKAKKFRVKGQLSAATGKIFLDRTTRDAIREYVLEAGESGPLRFPLEPKSFLICTKFADIPMTDRALQYAWERFQRRADLIDEIGKPRYRWHDLRHRALTAIGGNGNAFDVMKAGRFKSLNNAARYVHPSDERIFLLLEKAQK